MSITYPGKKLKDLFDQILKGEILVPNFQREFVWERDAQRKLLASLLTNIPIGSFLFLKGKKNFFSSKKIGFRIPLSINSSNNESSLFLLDGQQRLACLYNIFYDFFKDATSKEKKNEIYDSIYQKLKSRWFVRIRPDEEEDDWWGFKNLKFDQDKIKNAEPADIESFIEVKRDLKSGSNPYSPFFEGDVSQITSYFASKHLLPLYSLYPINDESLFIKVLRKISNERMTDLRNELSEKEQRTFLINALDQETVDESDNMELLWYELSTKYQSDLKNYFEKIFDSYTVPTIELPENEINRSIYIFENLNKGGTRLSTFDLIVAKVFKLGDDLSLRDKLRNILSEPMEIPDSIEEFEKGWSGQFINAINQKNRDIAKEIEDQFLNLLSILINTSDNLDDLRVEHIKQKVILELPNDKINYNLENACLGLKRALAFLQFRCGIINLKDLNYKLMILPLAYLFCSNDVWESKNKVDKLEYWYWLSLFSGRYRERQNERCIEDVKEVYKFLQENNENIKNKLKLGSERFRNILNVQGYSDKDVLLRNDKENEIPAAIRNGIIEFILSRKPSDLDFSAKNLSEVDKISAVKIAIDEQDIEIHHIIPLSEATNIGESSQELRRDKDLLLNSPLNLTIIQKKTNQKIKSYSPADYLQEIISKIGSLPLHDHLIPNDHSLFKNIKENPTESNIKEFCNRRYQEIERAIKEELRKLWES